ncbi:hypothetical protein M0R88_17545 [Halorussus gelatinilyticus]|uniref:Uncharacterized protein n=1 Tax=Halorussus gelatinilyticus TaxID=2937524 RepID=A0A8U0IJQ5_9EURY|nr:hypothetical protein [Halorussus gelatinilyticus]UPW00299.1 hypothetical protein M0R88_17545 [Halorussus gelatinilyticus]
MNARPLPAVALALAVLLAGVGPAVGVGTDSGDDGPVQRPGESIHRTAGAVSDANATASASDAGASDADDSFAQYKVSLENVTVKTWLIRNSTVLNATVRNVVVRNATTENGRRTNVTLSNVSVGRFAIERARMKNVTARKLVIRNKSVLNVPGGSFFDPNVENRTIDRQWTKNSTVSGVVIDRLVVDAAILCGNTSLGQRTTGDPIAPAAGEKKPDIVVENGTVGEALIIKGEASNWSVGSVNRSAPTNATLPQGCNRG